MHRPETVRLEISRGDWLLVRKRLTAGEQRQIFKRMMVINGSGPQVDPIQVGLSKMVGYLLDWSITDADDKPVVIQDQPEDAIASALDALDYDSYQEIQQAIETHEKSMDVERTAEKNSPGGENKLSAISPSPESLAGAMSGSISSTETSTPSLSKSSRKNMKASA